MSKWVMRAHFRHLHPRAFQWYKKLFNSLSFDPCNCSLKIWESTGISTPKVEIPLEVWEFIPSHFPTFLGTFGVTLGLPSWPTTSQTLVLVASPRLGLWQMSHLKSSYVMGMMEWMCFKREKLEWKTKSRILGHHSWWVFIMLFITQIW
jgi:hypothetical protein